MKIPAIRSIRACSLAAGVFLCAFCLSCYSYRMVRLDKKVRVYQPVASGSVGTALNADSSLKQFSFHSKKSFCRVVSVSPASKIINRGVDLALRGRFPAAAVLFEKVLSEENVEAAACNNLAIIQELFKNRDMAFELYSRACLMEPENRVFRENFLSFVETGSWYENVN